MDARTFREAVASAKATELNRLGSGNLLVALTDASLDRESVLAVAADSEYAAAETFRAWADDEPVGAAREAFEAVHEQERDHYERVVAHLPDHDPPEPGGPLHAYLRGLEGAIERAGAGLVGRPLVSTRAHTQVISFFVNEADEGMADLFRDLKAETGEELDRGLDVLSTLCDGEDDWERARATAEYAVQVAYDDYADALDGLGLDPRPIC
ncbi:MAG: rubrerythrin family protein [Halobacteriales archaeon]